MKTTSTAILAVAALLFTGLTAGVATAASPESKCKSCHSFDQGGKHKNGPNLFSIVGSKAGSTDFRKYGKSLKDGAWVWDEENLKAWVCDSKQAIKDLTGDKGAKTKMGKQKKCDDDAVAVVDFLKTLK
ncbi:MAG: c-type cytochrome [Mariprofundaceae bacterium]|nr:c-type cytochrome [Mariprofundaceae bacterium]